MLRRSAFDRLLDAHVAVEEADPREVGPEPLPEERGLIAGAVPGRVAQFAAGRACARRALSGLGGPAGQPILRSPDRAPIWPLGFVGSITHTDCWCAAAVARSSEVRAIGIDLERATPLRQAVLDKVCTPKEQRRLRRTADPELLAKVVFSAKEAVYKCQHTLTGKYLGFHAVEVELADETFVASFTQEAGEFRAGDTLLGRYRVSDDLVATACVLEAR